MIGGIIEVWLSNAPMQNQGLDPKNLSSFSSKLDLEMSKFVRENSLIGDYFDFVVWLHFLLILFRF